MKFCKIYQDYMQGQKNQLHAVDFKKLKKILKKCREDFESHQEQDGQSCPRHCSVCDGTFFPSLLKEMSAVVGCFNERAQKLLELHLASGFRKYFMWLTGKLQKNHVALIQEGKDLVTYALINAIAVRKILKKYDKIHYSKQGQNFKSKAQSMHMEILQSPWFCELMAFHINLREEKVKSNKAPALLEGCSLNFDDENPSLSCELFDSIKIDIDLTCSICLDTVFDPVSLTCGHIFCHTCACSAASVTIVDGLKAAEPKEKCPLCRKAQKMKTGASRRVLEGYMASCLYNVVARSTSFIECWKISRIASNAGRFMQQSITIITGVYEGSLHLEEINILLSRSCHEHWEQRLQTERRERIRQVKEHWESQCRAFMGV